MQTTKTRGNKMADDHTAARNVNRDILINELDLRQVSNTTIYLKGKYFVLSPSVQNSYNWFDLRLVNLKQFDRKNQKGYLLIRFFDKFLLADLGTFLQTMISKENFVKTKVSGVHWKFNIMYENGRYIIVNQRDKSQFVIDEVTLEDLKHKIGRIIEDTAIPKVNHTKMRGVNNNEDMSLLELREKITVLSEQLAKDMHDTKSINSKEPHKKRERLVRWFQRLFRGNI
jgi:hypothetical protein